MDVNKEELSLEIRPGEVEQESSEGEVYLGLVVGVEAVDELSVGFDAVSVLEVPCAVGRVGVYDLSA